MDPLDSRSVGQKFSNFVDRLGVDWQNKILRWGAGRRKLLLVLGWVPIILLEMDLKMGAERGHVIIQI